jgi:hypothetical protein
MEHLIIIIHKIIYIYIYIMDYYKKYLKYKIKYNKLKNIIGSGKAVRIEWKGGNYVGKVNENNRPHDLSGYLKMGDNIFQGEFKNGEFMGTTYFRGKYTVQSTSINRIINNFLEEQQLENMVQQFREIYRTSIEIFNIFNQKYNKDPQLEDSEYVTSWEILNRFIRDQSASRYDDSPYNVEIGYNMADTILERARQELPELTPQKAWSFWYRTVGGQRTGNNDLLYKAYDRVYTELVARGL